MLLTKCLYLISFIDERRVLFVRKAFRRTEDFLAINIQNMVCAIEGYGQ
jgi:hypothetical protein